ncbi:hypothetical protein SDC9_130233 [bioreactor metagenome]|uniref:Uncharacterized protein n=1 Tax=bioreactor metagenome TaxID=1076179 RepID=A0A645D0X6_9ZZZZ
MGQVPAGDQDNPAAKLLGGTRDASAEMVMGQEGKARDRYPNSLVIFPIVLHEMKRDQHAVIQGFIPFPDCPGRYARLLCPFTETFDKCSIVIYAQGNAGCAEVSEISLSAMTGGDVNIIPIHDRMGRDHHDGFGFKLRDFVRGIFIGVDGRLYTLFLAFSDLRDDQRRMGQDKSSQNRHVFTPLLTVFFFIYTRKMEYTRLCRKEPNG